VPLLILRSVALAQLFSGRHISMNLSDFYEFSGVMPSTDVSKFIGINKSDEKLNCLGEIETCQFLITRKGDTKVENTDFPRVIEVC